MIRTYTTLIILLSFLKLSSAQTTKGKDHEVGMNVTLLITELIHFNDDPPSLDPYLVTYKFVSNHHAIRSGVGFNANDDVIKDTLQNFSTGFSDFDIRAGYEYRAEIFNRWRAGFGIDVLYNKNSDRIRNFTPLDNVVNGSKGWVIGGGPVITLQFDINSRISLSAETTLYYHYGESTEYETFEAFPELNTESTGINRDFNISPPANLFVVIRL